MYKRMKRNEEKEKNVKMQNKPLLSDLNGIFH